MRRSEAGEFEFCAECGAEVHVSRDRAYALDADRFLCFECAAKRGGSYDERRDLWVEVPDVADLRSDET